MEDEYTNSEMRLLREGIDYPAFSADCDERDCDDEVLLAAKKAFGISYLYPWQRIVIANILDAASSYGTSHFDLCAFSDDCVSDESVFDRRAGEEVSGGVTAAAGRLSADSADFGVQVDSAESAMLSDVFCTGQQIVLLPTGAGKSLCFLTPALLLPGPTLVLYPLLALMADQKRRMDAAGIQSVVFRGQQSAKERERAFSDIHGGAKIILANPEVLQNEELVNRLSVCGISHIAIDEAHCVSEWGDSFRPAYLTLGNIIKKLNVRVVTAFTATASPSVLSRVAEVLFDGRAHIVRSESDRPNIHYHVVNAFAKKRAAFQLALTEKKPLIIFCGTRRNAEDMARELSLFCGNDNVRFYHAGMEKDEKTSVEQWFFPKKDAILCCTCAFGMGVDKRDIHTVIHLEPSPTAEAYIQEAGRGGRDGSVAKAILLWSPNDRKRSERFLPSARERVLARFAQAGTCRRQILLDALGGEQAFCDGCDVCERNGAAPFAQDAERVLDYVRHHRKCFGMHELQVRLLSLMNGQDKAVYGQHVWEQHDIKEILEWLLREKLLRIALWPWSGKVDCMSPFFKSRLYRRYALSILRLHRRIQRLRRFVLLARAQGLQQRAGAALRRGAFSGSALRNLQLKIPPASES